MSSLNRAGASLFTHPAPMHLAETSADKLDIMRPRPPPPPPTLKCMSLSPILIDAHGRGNGVFNSSPSVPTSLSNIVDPPLCERIAAA